MKEQKQKEKRKETNNLVLGTRLGSRALNGSSLKNPPAVQDTGDEVPSLGWEDP